MGSLLGHGLLHVDPLSVDLVVALLDGLVHRVVVVELDEAEALLLAGVALSQPERSLRSHDCFQHYENDVK